jgi:hypothetical protein
MEMAEAGGALCGEWHRGGFVESKKNRESPADVLDSLDFAKLDLGEKPAGKNGLQGRSASGYDRLRNDAYCAAVAGRYDRRRKDVQ